MGENMKTVFTQACGRVNLIGEHTDYNDGWVLPTTIPQKTYVRLITRDDQTVVARSSNYQESHGRAASYQLGEETKSHSWHDYIQGVTAILRQKGIQVSGFELAVDSDIPIGSGLSSSAALEVSLLKALREAFSLKLTDVEIAQIGQLAENEFVGAHVGIMDQMACSLAHEGEALFLDTKTLSYRQIPLPQEKMDLLVINSGVVHQHAGGDYNQRRAECEEACRLLGIKKLREFGMMDLPKLESLPEILRKRARHVITENDRVHQSVEALLKKDVHELGRLFYESHRSMEKDYEVSVREIDLLIELCRRNAAVFGARLTGGGFGGSIVALTEPGQSTEIAQRICAIYEKETSCKASVLVAGNKKSELSGEDSSPLRTYPG
jgi:galactokinase